MQLVSIPLLLIIVLPALAQSIEDTLPTDQLDIMAQPQQQADQVAESKTQEVRPDEQPDEDDDNAPMVHYIPKDYRSWAFAERETLQSQGEEVVLMSELPTLIPREPDESGTEYVRRYTNKMNEMIRRGVSILNDQCNGDVAPNLFTVGGHDFDVGPESGITKRQYREFGEWIGSEEAGEKGYEGVPRRFLKFEVQGSRGAETEQVEDENRS